jgi:hypothetical protein
MLFTGHGHGASRPRTFQRSTYSGIERTFLNNLHYIGNIRALRAWYRDVRPRVMAADPYREACRLAALATLDAILDERLRRLGDVADVLSGNTPSAGFDEAASWRTAVDAYRRLQESWSELQVASAAGESSAAVAPDREAFLAGWNETADTAVYTQAVASLSPSLKASGTAWLRALVDEVVDLLPKPEAENRAKGHS